MTKHYCDLCGRELTNDNKSCHEIIIVRGDSEKQPPVKEVCYKCAKKITDVVEEIQGSNEIY